MMSKKLVVFILPHFDDEIFVIPKIRRDLTEGHDILFFFLINSELRLSESVSFLRTIGINPKNIISIGEQLNIEDGYVHLKLEEIFQVIEIHLQNTQSDRIEFVCTAYEGGHNDHDAAAVLSRVLAKTHNAHVFEFFLYNGINTSGKFYRVSSPIPGIKSLKISYTFSDYTALLRIPFFYRSQLKALLGLLPFLFARAIFFPLTLNVININDSVKLNHSHTPLYERWKRITYIELKKRLEFFITSKDSQ